jgi:hypothetical protein
MRRNPKDCCLICLLARLNRRRFKLYPPKMWRRGKKFNSHTLPAVSGFTDEYDPAFLLFLRNRIFEDNHFAVIHFIAQIQQSAMRIYDYGLANFAKLLTVVRAAMHLQPHLVEDALASPRTRSHSFLHAPILGSPVTSVNCPKVQVSPNCNASSNGSFA